MTNAEKRKQVAARLLEIMKSLGIDIKGVVLPPNETNWSLNVPFPIMEELLVRITPPKPDRAPVPPTGLKKKRRKKGSARMRYRAVVPEGKRDESAAKRGPGGDRE